MDVRQEIANQVEKLSPDMQEQVLRFVASLASSAPEGESGALLRRFSSTLDSASAREMIPAARRAASADPVQAVRAD